MEKGCKISNTLVGFGQSQCTVPAALVGRRGFVENEVFERGGA